MKLSYVSVFIFIFLLFNVYAVDYDPVDPIDWDPVDPPGTGGSLIPSMPADFSNILGAGMIGVSIGILLAALAYMLGNFFGFPQMIGWSKNQLWESVYTMFLVSSILVFSIVVHIFPVGVPEALQTNMQIPFPEKAAMSLDNIIYGEIDMANLPDDVKKEIEGTGFITTNNIGLKRLFYLSYVDQIFLNVAYNLFSLEIGTGLWKFFEGANAIFSEGEAKFSGQFLSGFKKLMGLSGTISNYFLSLLLILYAQLGLLIFVSGGSIFLFGFGVFFRCIPFTRKLGSTLISLFVVLYFVYPAFVIFVFSDGMYGEMSKTFEGVYVQDQWFEGMENIDPNGIVVIEPYGLNQVAKGEDVYMRFYSFIFPEFNYSIKSNNKIICEGSNYSGAMIECNLKGTVPNNLINPNSDEFKSKIKSAIENEEYKDVGTKVTYEILLSYEKGTDSFSYPENNNPLSFNVYYSDKCVSDLCYQSVTQLSNSLESSVSAEVREELLSPMKAKLEEGYTEGKVADVAILATKATLLGLGTKLSGGKATVILAGLLFKNDISGFFYDEVTCDPYMNMIAVDYFNDDSDPIPKPLSDGDGGSLDFIKSLKEFGSSLKEKSVDYYGKSDYMSCNNALGVENGGVMASFFQSLSGTPGWTSKHMSVVFAPIVYVFISFIYTIVFSVTFFKSLSESIGGDSSLMGLGKLL